jgi:hemerythrin-like metal-binding protein
MSQFLTWKEEFNTGCEEIDRQHQKLGEILNELYQAFEQGLAESHVIKILNELEEYTKYHFSTEEELFEKYNYPYKEQHKAEHQKLVEQVRKFRLDYEQNKSTLLSYEVLITLKQWLLDHVLGSDRKYIPYLCK